jgi:3-hydroxy-3-methylglutaryl CoA synthase/uncharacterized OB-fold protein
VTGVLAYGAYVPRYRLDRADRAALLATSGDTGTRSVASYDEDVTSMAVEAGRIALRGVDAQIRRLYFATTSPPYLDKTNAAVIHAALELDRSVLAVDMGGAPRSGTGAMLAAADATVPTLALLSDMRTGRPGSTDERGGGDAAAAFLFGPETPGTPVLATVLASASTTEEFLERWRIPGDIASRLWEERFGEHVYGPLADDAFSSALKLADLTPTQVDHLIVSGLAPRAVKAFAKGSGVRPEAIVPDRASSIGNPGLAQAGLLLTDVLERAQPGETIALVHLADGATAVLLRATDHLIDRRASSSEASRVSDDAIAVSYPMFLSWRGFLDREPPRRPEPDAPASPPTYRSNRYKYAFRGTRCENCGTVNVPPSRVCYSCSTVDQMVEKSMSRVPGTVVTFTVDRLAFTPSPPMVAVVVDFDGGGRFRCELADAGPDDVRIGMRVEPTFRRLLTADGVHNYFWKAKPLPPNSEER